MVLKGNVADVPIPEVKVYNGLFHFNPSTTRGKWFFFAQVCRIGTGMGISMLPRFCENEVKNLR